MTWNYRVLKKVTGDETTFAVHEVYYDDQGIITAWSEDAMGPHGETLDELRKDLQWFRHALKKAVLIESRNTEGKAVLVPEI